MLTRSKICSFEITALRNLLKDSIRRVFYAKKNLISDMIALANCQRKSIFE